MFPLFLICGALGGIYLSAPESYQNLLDSLIAVLIGGVFFLQGARLKDGALLEALKNWKTQARIVFLSFVAFPICGIAIYLVARAILPPASFTPLLATGFVFLCCLPSTVQSSVALTAIARGDMAVSITSSAVSSLCGILLTPALMWLITQTGIFSLQQPITLGMLGHILLRLVYELLIPFALGRLLAPYIGGYLRKLSWLKYWDQGSIVLMVYSVFCSATHRHLWSSLSVETLTVLVVLELVLLCSMLCVSWFVGSLGGVARPIRIAVQFCGSKKALSSAIPLCTVLSADNAGILLIPVMLYHQLQLFVASFLAHRYAKQSQPAE